MNRNFLIILPILLVMLMPFALAISGSASGSFDVAAGGGNIVISQPGTPQHYCGNWIYEFSIGEQCDGSDLPFTQCSEYLGSSYSGTLSCKSGCILDTSQCVIEQQITGSSGGGSSGGGSSGGGSSGGSGSSSSSPATYSGSSSSKSCVENWECTEWSNDGLCGTRTCTDKNKCKTTKLKPVEELDCEIIGIENKGLFSGITGAVTGVIGSPLGIGVLIFILAILGIYIYAFIMRKRAEDRK